jgi:hypothetical protein
MFTPTLKVLLLTRNVAAGDLTKGSEFVVNALRALGVKLELSAYFQVPLSKRSTCLPFSVSALIWPFEIADEAIKQNKSNSLVMSVY